MTQSDIATEAVKAAPPVTVVTATVAGYPLNDIVLMLTLVYVALQIGLLLYKWWRLAHRPNRVATDEE